MRGWKGEDGWACVYEMSVSIVGWVGLNAVRSEGRKEGMEAFELCVFELLVQSSQSDRWHGMSPN